MKKFIIPVILFVSFVSVFPQARPNLGGAAKKANQRPIAEQNKSTTSAAQNDSADAPDDGEVIKIDTDLVIIPFKVSDRSNRFIANLKKEDFKVYDDNAEQEIAYFSNEEQPFTVALVLDMSYSSAFKIGEIQSAARAFLAQLRPQDKVLLVSFDGEIHVLSEPTSDRKALSAAIGQTKIASGTSLYEAVDLVMNQKFRKIAGRKAIVLFTDGVDTSSRRVFSTDNLQDASELDALIYPVQYDTFADVQRVKNDPTAQLPNPSPLPKTKPGGLPFPLPLPTVINSPDEKGTAPEDYKKAGEYLQELANRSGGRIYQANSTANLALAFSRIADELRQQYSLGFYPPENAKAGQIHKIRVRSNQPNVVVRARDSYIMGRKKAGK